ncbi:Hypothetical protein NCS54_01099600 [Fusarium falciforme]|uniref:Hypothetical protein n=1 Tax=Fusarium falciforme TaxID=195108 RepID=UPI002300057F|nr:Hypothetical protein NCS54_01099600 [Fusarium falciforme]WAO93448.1 Hypothetical protein NCS54_01099600 [Fusarium falciforme]
MTSMTSTFSDAEQQKSRQSSSPPRSQAATISLCDDEAHLALGESKDATIWIFSDSETEDEDEEGQVVDDSQSSTTTATTITSHSASADTKSTKQSPPGSEVVVDTDATPAVSSAWAEDDSNTDPPAGPELSQQSLFQSNRSSAGSYSACIDASLNLSPASPENHPYLVVSDRQQLVSESTEPASEPGMTTIDALSNEGSCRGGQSTPASPSMSTHSTVTATAGEMAQTLLHGSEVCTGTSPDDVTPGDRNSSLEAGLSHEPHQGQDLDDASCGSSDAESEAVDGGPGSPFGAQAFPQLPFPRRSRRRSPYAHATAQEEDSDADTEGSSSEDGLDDPQSVHDEDYCPRPSTAQGPSSGDDSDDEEQHGRKRRRVSRSAHTRSAPQRRRTRRTAALLRGRRRSACGIDSPPSLQARPTVSERRFEEWPLGNASLKCVTEGDKKTFQIQFEWTPGSPDSCQRHADRSESLPRKSRGPPKASLSATRSSGGKWTLEEDDIVRKMRQNGDSWAEIQCALPHRSQGTIQVRYSTKLKYLPSSER